MFLDAVFLYLFRTCIFIVRRLVSIFIPPIASVESEMENEGALFPDPLLAKNDHNSTETLLKLNDDCLLEIYKRLPLKDARTLAETSVRLKHVYMMFRYHQFTFEFHSDMYHKRSKNGKTVLDNILSEYCNYIRSWSLTIDNNKEGLSLGTEVLKTVAEYSTNLKRLEFLGFYGLKDSLRDCTEAADCLKNVEVLTFKSCGVVDSAEFLQCFRSLKHLHFTLSGTTTKDLQLLFENNPGIESYYNHGSDSLCGDSHNFERFTESEFNACKFGAKFHTLSLGADCESLDMHKMLRLTTINLTKLKIECFAKNLTIFLTEIAKRGILRELELSRVKIDLDGLKVFRNFTKLQLFVFCPYDRDNRSFYELDSTFMWPPKLKYLRSEVRLSEAAYLSLIRQLPLLTHLQLDIFRSRFNNVAIREHDKPDFGIPTVYPNKFRHYQMNDSFYKGRRDKLIEIDFSISKSNKRKVFTY